MPVLKNFAAPASAKKLELPQDPNFSFFIAFISSSDVTTKQPWCPDVRRALPYIRAAFAQGDAPDVALVEVGQIPEWRDVKNVFRANWNVSNVPTLVRYQRVNGEARETGRLIESQILDEKRLGELIGKADARL